MENKIDNQSKNEVKELLNEYIVEPLEKSKKLDNIIKKIDETNKEIEDSISGKLSPISGRITSCLTNLITLGEEIEEIKNNILDTNETTEKNLDDLGEKISHLDNKFEKKFDETDNKIENIKTELSTAIENKYKNLLLLISSFGVLNLIGIIAIIMLCIIK